MRPVFGALIALAIVLSACGGGDADPSPRVVNASDFEFDVVAVAAGQEVTVQLRNSGNVEHNWTLLAAGVSVATSAEVVDSDVLATVTADPSQSVSTRFTAPAPGTYQVICIIEGHLEAGMNAMLVSS